MVNTTLPSSKARLYPWGLYEDDHFSTLVLQTGVIFSSSGLIQYLVGLKKGLDNEQEFGESLKLFNARFFNDDSNLENLTITTLIGDPKKGYFGGILSDMGCYFMDRLAEAKYRNNTEERYLKVCEYFVENIKNLRDIKKIDTRNIKRALKFLDYIGYVASCIDYDFYRKI